MPRCSTVPAAWAVPVVPVALDRTLVLMKKGALDAGDGSMRKVTVRVGKPIHPLTTGREGVRVNDLRQRTYEAIADLLRSLGGQVPEVLGAARRRRDGGDGGGAAGALREDEDGVIIIGGVWRKRKRKRKRIGERA